MAIGTEVTEVLDSAALYIYCKPSAVVCILVRGPRTRDLGTAIRTDL